MFVHRSMTPRVITIGKEASLLEAKDLMRNKNIRHLPVVDEQQKLIGIITDRDIRGAMPLENVRLPDFCKKMEVASQLKVGDVMTPDPITIGPHDTIEDALLMFEQKKVGAFPVIDAEGRLKGIISVRDILRAFTNVLGIGQPGTLLCILVEEKVGQLKKIVDAITEEGISFGSVLVARYWDENKRAVFPYLLTNNVVRVKQKLKALGFELLDPMEWYIDQLPRHERDG
ncbi:MAG TPA: CBS domain-containing protein [Desulfobacteraceae bacterium]|nr:MAG: CBS domain-containing protein [Deltaproteobacteria bacterium]HDI61153.1 CBS domain-containing protein [Desulfobacteraceae bacterium]